MSREAAGATTAAAVPGHEPDSSSEVAGASAEARLTPRGRATRERILGAARELLATSPTLEVAQVARRAGVAIGLPYRYFGSKDGLVTAVVDDFHDRYEAAVFLAPLAPEASWTERELLRLAREVDLLYDDPLGPVIVGRRLHEPAAVAADQRRLAGQIDHAARNIERGQASGALEPSLDARLAAAAILGGFRELVGEALARPVPPPREAVVEIAWRVGLATLRRPGTAAAASGGAR